MTLIEVVIALLIVVMMVGVAIPTLNNITRAELRTSASKTSGMIKSTYDQAVLSGHTHRLVFDLDKKTITAEVATGYVSLTRGGESEGKQDKKDKEKEKSHGSGVSVGSSSADDSAAILAIAKHDTTTSSFNDNPVQKASFTAVSKPYELADGVRIADLQSEHLREPVKVGRESIYFFPTGYSEHAIIHFEDNGGHVYAVEVEALSGRTKILDHHAEYRDEP